jgi:hypothetical protein
MMASWRPCWSLRCPICRILTNRFSRFVTQIQPESGAENDSINVNKILGSWKGGWFYHVLSRVYNWFLVLMNTRMLILFVFYASVDGSFGWGVFNSWMESNDLSIVLHLWIPHEGSSKGPPKHCACCARSLDRCRVFILPISRNLDLNPVDQVDQVDQVVDQVVVDKMLLSLSMAPHADLVHSIQQIPRPVQGVQRVQGVQGVQVGKRKGPKRVPHPALLLWGSTETCRHRKISLLCSPFAEKTSRSLILWIVSLHCIG